MSGNLLHSEIAQVLFILIVVSWFIDPCCDGSISTYDIIFKSMPVTNQCITAMVEFLAEGDNPSFDKG